VRYPSPQKWIRCPPLQGVDLNITEMDQMPSTSRSRPEHHRNGSDALHFCDVQVYSLKWRASDPFLWCSGLLLEVEGI
jgi:hypothetical protein